MYVCACSGVQLLHICAMRAMRRWSSIRYLIIKYFIKVEEFARASGLAYARATEIEYPFTPVYNTFILVYAFICVSLVHFNIHI